MSKRKLIVGNWKMNPATLDEAKEIAKKTRAASADLARTDAVMCPPYVFIAGVMTQNESAHASLGAQNVSFEDGGAHTGEVSVGMLKSLGVEYVILGHSEVRAAGDTDEMVSKRAVAALGGGLTTIICCGEKVRDEAGSHFEFIKNQLKNSLANIPKNKASSVVLAYEPIWAIGAKDAMNPEQVYEMSLFVRKCFGDMFDPDAALKVQVLYGGAVNSKNAADIMSIGKVDGLLVGRASVTPVDFAELLKAVDAIV